MIIDCHVHINNYHEERVVSLTECIDKLQAEMAANKVDHALILTSYKVTPHRPPTGEVIRAAEKHKNLGVVAGISYVNYKERDLREISDFLKDGRVKGLKLYPGYEPFYPYDKRCQVVYDLAMEYDVPVMIHTGDTYTPGGKVRYAHPLNIDDVAVDNPGLKIVVCHLGNPWIRDCMEVVYKNANVYADISGLVLGDFNHAFEKYMRTQVKEMLTFAGEPKYLLYGSDWPLASMESYLDFMKDLRLPEKDRELILWKNSAALFKIDVGAPIGDASRTSHKSSPRT